MNKRDIDKILSKKDSEKKDEAVLDVYKVLDSLELILDIKIKKIIVDSLFGNKHVTELDANMNQAMCLAYRQILVDIKVDAEKLKKED